MALCAGHALCLGIDEVVAGGFCGEDSALADVGLQVKEPLVVHVVGQRHQPLVVGQLLNLVEMVVAAIVGVLVHTEILDHDSPSVQRVLQHGTGHGVVRIAQHLAREVVVQVALLGRVQLRRRQLAQPLQVGAGHVAQRAPLLQRQVGGQIVLRQHGVEQLGYVVGVDTDFREFVYGESGGLEALVYVLPGFLLVLDDGAAVNEVVVADELRQVAHTVGLHQRQASVPDVLEPQDFLGALDVVLAQESHIEQARGGEAPESGEHLFHVVVVAVHDDAPLGLVPYHFLRVRVEAFSLQLILAAEGHHLRLGLGHLAANHLEAVGRVAVVAVEESHVWCRHEEQAVVARHGRRELPVVQLLDNDVLVVFEYIRQKWQIKGLAIMNHNNPLNVLEPDGLAAHGVGTFLEHAHVHIMERRND